MSQVGSTVTSTPGAAEGQPPAGPILLVEDLEVARDGITLLPPTSFEVQSGDLLAVCGPSGCGKTTMLRSMCRLIEPTAGRVLYRGEDIRAIPATVLRRRVLFIPQVPVMIPGTVGENLVLSFTISGEEPPQAARLTALLAEVGLESEYLGRAAEKLSVGQAMRVALARGLLAEPDVLLLDEPTASLDADTAEAVERLIQKVRVQHGLTVVMVTHDRDQAQRMADHVVWISPPGARSAPAEPPPQVEPSNA